MALLNASLNLLAIKDAAKQSLADLLQTIPHKKKTMVLDSKLQGPLMMVADKKMLAENGVEKTIVLQPGMLESETKDVVYIVRPSQEAILTIVEHVKHLKKKNLRRDVHVFMVPRRTIVAERILEEEEVLPDLRKCQGDFFLGEFHLEMVPLDDDLISLELPDCFKECFLDGNKETLYYVAQAIMKLQMMFGIFPHIRGKGHCSKIVCDMLVRMRKEMRLDDLKVPPEVETLVLLDRDLDLVTPLFTQLTYEGLIDDLYGISSAGTVQLSTDITGPPPNLPQGAPVPKTMKVPLNSTDDVHQALRDLPVTALGPELRNQAQILTDIENERAGLQDKGVTEIKDFVKKLKEMNLDRKKLLIGMHTNLAVEIGSQMKADAFKDKMDAEQTLLRGSESHTTDLVEDAIYLGEKLTTVLRLLCLQSQIFGGLKKFEYYRTELVNTYGYKVLFTLVNLEKLKMLCSLENRERPFSAIINSFDLFTDELNQTSHEHDIRYTYQGYAPVSARLVEQALSPNGWRGCKYESSLKLLPGPHVDVSQKIHGLNRDIESQDGAPKVVLVCFIGGCTFAEISAVRLLQKTDPKGRKFIIITTKIMNGNALIHSVQENLNVAAVAESAAAK